MEAHNALSARIVEEAGFRGIWASGLSISAALGVRDNNEASWTQVLEVVEFMSDATDVPILLDGDTGYGNFNNMRRLVKKLEQRGIAAVCIEDKLFPKTNSFIGSERQPLATIDEFTGKIKAVKDAQRDPDFCLVARLEGFIAGWGIDEMLLRAEAYHLAGADALLIHSKKVTPDQVLAFAKAWANKCPLVIAPTTYYSTPVEVFEQAGIAIVIWANQNVRSAIAAMQETTRRIFTERSVQNVEDGIVPVKEVFRLQNAEELLLAEERYLPKGRVSTRAIILAASRGNELGEVTAGIPKAMVPVGGTPLLHKLAAQFRVGREQRPHLGHARRRDQRPLEPFEGARMPRRDRERRLPGFARWLVHRLEQSRSFREPIRALALPGRRRDLVLQRLEQRVRRPACMPCAAHERMRRDERRLDAQRRLRVLEHARPVAHGFIEHRHFEMHPRARQLVRVFFGRVLCGREHLHARIQRSAQLLVRRLDAPLGWRRRHTG